MGATGWPPDMSTISGTPPARIDAKLGQLEARQAQREKDLAAASEAPAATTLHPRIAETYPDRIRALIAGLSEPEAGGDAREAIRGLIDRIVVTQCQRAASECGRW